MRNKRYRKNSHSKRNNKFKILFIISVILMVFMLSIIIKQSSNNNNLNFSDNLSDVNSNIQNNVENISNEENSFLDDTIQNDTNNLPTQESVSPNITFKMAVTGDIMCHNTVYMDAYNSSKKEYDFSYMLEDIKYHLQTADIAIGNLETTFAGSKYGYSGYPTFNTPEILAKNLKKAGFDVVSPYEYNLKMGSWINLDDLKKEEV